MHDTNNSVQQMGMKRVHPEQGKKRPEPKPCSIDHIGHDHIVGGMYPQLDERFGGEDGKGAWLGEGSGGKKLGQEVGDTEKTLRIHTEFSSCWFFCLAYSLLSVGTCE